MDIVAVCRAALYAAANRRSSDNSWMAASSRSRRMTARKSSSSFLLVLCAWTLLSACSFFQLIQRTRNGDQLTLEDGIKKMIPALPLDEEFGFGVPRYVHFAPELLFDPPQGGEKFGHSNRANDQQIDVALRLLLAPRDGAVDGRPFDLAAESLEFRFEKRNDPRCFREQRAKCVKYRGGGLGPVVGATAVLLALQNAAFGESLELPLKAGGRSREMRSQLGQIPRFLRREQRRCEDLLADLREQRIKDG